MAANYSSVMAACGKVPRAVFLKAARRLRLSNDAYRMADEVLVKGFRQATVARHVGVTRQRVHAVCHDVLDEINKLQRTD